MILKLACLASKVPRSHCMRQLDDAICLSSEENVNSWYKGYDGVADYVGVRLAGTKNPAKACGPCQKGQLLGIEVNLVDFLWSIDEKKANKIFVLLYEILEKDWVSTEQMAKLCGKLTHYAPIFKPGHFERGFLIHAYDPTARKLDKVKVTLAMKSQASWWIKNLYSGLKETQIPLPWTPISSDPVMLYSDAAGPGHGGAGAIAFENFVIAAFVPWPSYIDSGSKARSGYSLGRNMTTLEAVSGLLALTMDPDRVRNRSVVLVTDNMAVMLAYKSGHSKDPLCYSVVKAFDVVARALNAKLTIRHQKRCSDPPTIAADMMSRGRTQDIFKAINSPTSKLGWVSETLCSWLADPFPTRILGAAIVREMSHFTAVLRLEVEWEEELNVLGN